MDQELKQYLDAKFARMDEKFADADQRAQAREEALEERLKALNEKTETSLLRAFYGWARPMELRVDGTSKFVVGFDERLALAEQRISELERRRAS